MNCATAPAVLRSRNSALLISLNELPLIKRSKDNSWRNFKRSLYSTTALTDRCNLPMAVTRGSKSVYADFAGSCTPAMIAGASVSPLLKNACGKVDEMKF